jgi:hypothetical protein
LFYLQLATNVTAKENTKRKLKTPTTATDRQTTNPLFHQNTKAHTTKTKEKPRRQQEAETYNNRRSLRTLTATLSLSLSRFFLSCFLAVSLCSHKKGHRNRDRPPNANLPKAIR